MGVSIQVDDQGARITLGQVKAAVADSTAPLASAGDYMISSIHRTFREEGSPAGSWPRLALSTTRKKGYTTGHQLLVMSGTLFYSFTKVVTPASVVVGVQGLATKYAAVQNFGSADRSGGSIGAQAKIPGREVKVEQFHRRQKLGKGMATVKDKRGRVMQRLVNIAGPQNRRLFAGYTRHQNIPARPYAVFRPEDPAAIIGIFERYLAGRSTGFSIGAAGAV